MHVLYKYKYIYNLLCVVIDLLCMLTLVFQCGWFQTRVLCASSRQLQLLAEATGILTAAQALVRPA